MPTPQEIEAAAGIQPADELERKRIWAAAQARAAVDGRAPSPEDLRLAEQMLEAARRAAAEHLEEGRGRATITLTDSGQGDEVDVALEFEPELEHVSDEEVAGTPAQVLALELVQGALGNEENGPIQ